MDKEGKVVLVGKLDEKNRYVLVDGGDSISTGSGDVAYFALPKKNKEGKVKVEQI